MATRVAEERGAILGDEVGYLIRFDDCFHPDATRIKVRLYTSTLFLIKLNWHILGLSKQGVLRTGQWSSLSRDLHCLSFHLYI